MPTDLAILNTFYYGRFLTFFRKISALPRSSSSSNFRFPAARQVDRKRDEKFQNPPRNFRMVRKQQRRLTCCQHVDSGDAETAEFRSNPTSNVGDTKTVEFRKIPKIPAGLTLRTPQRPKCARFCIRRSNILSSGRTALLNALNITLLRSSLTEIRCSKISENSENRHRAHIAEPQAAKGLEILYTSK